MKKLASLVLASAMAVVPFAAGLAATFTPGEYEATAQGFAGAVTVKVTVDEEKVTAVTVTGENETPALGGAVIEGYNASLIGVADADAVDATAGATVTSKAILAAAEQALTEAGADIEALKTATAIGDDRLQKEATGRVVPDSFTHGTSLQRLNWFKKGFKSGNPNVCNTWQADKL